MMFVFSVSVCKCVINFFIRCGAFLICLKLLASIFGNMDSGLGVGGRVLYEMLTTILLLFLQP